MISERNGKHGQFKARIFEEQKKTHETKKPRKTNQKSLYGIWFGGKKAGT